MKLMIVLADSDILLEALLPRKNSRSKALKFWKMATNKEIEVYITQIGFNRAEYIVDNLPILEEYKERYKKNMRDTFKVIPVNLTKDGLAELAHMKTQDIESAIEIFVAKSNNIPAIVTQNKSYFEWTENNGTQSVRVYSIEEFLNLKWLEEIMLTDIELPEGIPVKFRSLYYALKSNKWEEADRETHSIMISIMGRTIENFLSVKDIENFPGEDFHIIDYLWTILSNKQFGFSIQKQIYLGVGGKLQEYEISTFEKFGESVGWRINGVWLEYEEIQFNSDAPRGHLPKLIHRSFWIKHRESDMPYIVQKLNEIELLYQSYSDFEINESQHLH